MAAAKIVARDLVKRYGSILAVDGVSLTVAGGEIYGLLGPNGAGKTTTLELMEGLRRPDSGTCSVCGFDSQKQERTLRERVGISFQAAALPSDVRVHELIELYASFYANPVPAGDLLRQFNLEEKARAFCTTLSGGQRQRLALALALVGRPEVVLLDEPTTGLDPQARQSLWDVIRGLRSEGRAVVLSTHYMEEAEVLCDRVAVMDYGRILAEGTPRDLTRHYGPEAAIEIDLDGVAPDLATLARLEAVTGLKQEENRVLLHTAHTAASLMALAAYAREQALPLRDLRTRNATLEDVFLALTGRRLRD